MKLFLVTTMLILTFSAATASECENESYQYTVQDYAGDCRMLITEAAVKNNCNNDFVKFLAAKMLEGKMINAVNGSSTFCKIESENGHYQVMTDDMPEPPVATVYFSRYD